jgi:hypothetical protein
VTVPDAVDPFARRLRSLGWVTDLLVGGSAATGDYRVGVSDLDLVAVIDGPIDEHRRATIVALHRGLDRDEAAGAHLGCVYIPESAVLDPTMSHPTWTHGLLVTRPLSGISRAELVRHGFAVFGRPPNELLPPMSDDDVRRAARAELTGYWASVARSPWRWLDPGLADLGLTSMARGRYAVATGTLLTKTAAIEAAQVPAWLRADLRARRDGEPARSPRAAMAWIAWRDARRTVAAARRWSPAP